MGILFTGDVANVPIEAALIEGIKEWRQITLRISTAHGHDEIFFHRILGGLIDGLVEVWCHTISRERGYTLTRDRNL